MTNQINTIGKEIGRKRMERLKLKEEIYELIEEIHKLRDDKNGL